VVASKTEKPQPTAVQKPANNASCASTVGVEKARQLVNQCIQISPATHPPCNAQNTCELITEEINRGCDLARSVGGKVPTFCQASSVTQAASTPQSSKIISAKPQVSGFQTPSKNILCFFSNNVENSGASNVECQIGQFTPSFDKAYAASRKDPMMDTDTCDPKRLSDYQISSTSQAGQNFCPMLDIGQAMLDNPSSVITLPYGSAFQKYGLTCISEQSGVTCQNTAGHGFFLSKAQQRLF